MSEDAMKTIVQLWNEEWDMYELLTSPARRNDKRFGSSSDYADAQIHRAKSRFWGFLCNAGYTVDHAYDVVLADLLAESKAYNAQQEMVQKRSADWRAGYAGFLFDERCEAVMRHIKQFAIQLLDIPSAT